MMECITDRTLSDVRNSTSKAYINACDLNRIWANAAALGGLLGVAITAPVWQAGEIPRAADWLSLHDAVGALRDAWPATGTSLPDFPMLDYTAWNALEQCILRGYDNRISFMVLCPRSGEAICGAEIGVI